MPLTAVLARPSASDWDVFTRSPQAATRRRPNAVNRSPVKLREKEGAFRPGRIGIIVWRAGSPRRARSSLDGATYFPVLPGCMGFGVA